MAGKLKPQPAMKNHSGIAMPQNPAPERSSRMIATAAATCRIVAPAMIHCGPMRFWRRLDTWTPMMTPIEFMPKSSPYSCALSA